MRIEFCEADILDVFDEWRRSVGIRELVDAGAPQEPDARPHESLVSHLDKLVSRLTIQRSSAGRSLDQVLDAIIRELDTLRAGARGIRGAKREALLQRLRELDAELLSVAREGCDAEVLRELSSEADVQLAPFRDRMAPDVYARSRAACIDRLMRERAGLPMIAVD